jgi:hypothetical protein
LEKTSWNWLDVLQQHASSTYTLGSHRVFGLVRSVIYFMMALSAYCLQTQSIGTGIGRKVLLRLEIGTFVLTIPLALIFFSMGGREYQEQTVPNTVW